MPRTKIAQREGFWRNDVHPLLPFPEGSAKSWKGKREFLAALKAKEEIASCSMYRGWSTCRLCSCRNGSSEYSLGSWVWPSGYAHYIKEHNVRPSLAFQKFIFNTNTD